MIKISLDKLKTSENIVELLDDNELALIGEQVFNGYKIDEDSRAEWKEIVDKAMDIAKQKMEPKNTPWPNASNVKFPLISQACVQFAARVMPEIIQNDRVVKCATVGKDPDDAKFKRAERVSRFLSYQLAVQSSDWEDGTDKLLQVLPVLGTVFKKTYWDYKDKRVCSELCVPEKIIVNYNTQSLERARRVTHCITLYKNDIIERQRYGIYSKTFDPSLAEDDGHTNDEDCPIELLEQHCYLDLDGDGYKEPYIVIIHKKSKAVLRIVNRFKSIEKNDKGEILCIEPVEYFTDFHFIRSLDGGFYSIGFGTLLLPLNSSINTLINQLLDAGTLNNMNSGFLGRGLRVKNGEIKLKMGEWKVLDAAAGTNIAQNVVPLPTKEPSQTLYQLLGLMLQIGKDLSGATDAMQGKQPAQNVAQGVLNQLIEQGSKIFTAINKRLYRGLRKEYTRIYELNSEYLTNTLYKKVLDDQEADVKADFELNTLDIYPVADPTISSDVQRINKASILQQLPTVDRRAADIYVLQAMQIDEAEMNRLLPEPDPKAPPPPEVQKIMAEIQYLQAQVAEISAKATLEAEKVRLNQQDIALKATSIEAQNNESAARVVKMQNDAANGRAKVAIAANKMQSQEMLKGAQFVHKQDKDAADTQIKVADTAVKDKKANAEMLKATAAATQTIVDSKKDDSKKD